ncbi:MAG: EscU/YscU/HrcU family type III secretion system export apparatus switch protein [Bacteroides sp.]|nr:EscU/YscU/HrcU family type III secretion system export apparatus switch protein [Prevotella sp.]MCM1408741.1 EscU/YscU/HrcU family type III secretion system export apparatus switch protein [Treponema brennaborense]MCM1470656.1 EscU/YscU/HrcU family type III secretion system export apparatus switch protein [Bacteroides sp.]
MKKTAAALRYPPYAEAPFIAAKGKGALAERIVKIAEQNNVPVVLDADMANILTLQEIGDCIPEETYEVLAGIFASIRNIYGNTAENTH